MASVGALRPCGLRRRLPWALGIMTLRALLTKERSMYRLIFGLISASFLALCLLHVLRGNREIATVLGGVSLLCFLVAAFFKERQIIFLAKVLIVANIVGAIGALVFGVKF